MKKRSLLPILISILIINACQKNADPIANQADVTVTIHPDKYKQTIWGLGFEIQSDAIGSGNTGLPDSKHAVPHDLTLAERERFAKEMLTGFRYCRLAGGLYWRGLDVEGKHLQPRWPEQLEEIRQMMEWAGVEGVSLEYWSPAPFWKANGKYVGESRKDRTNTLRCFGPDFATDSIYHGDTARFLKDFGNALATDVETLRKAGIKTLKWGLSNEPFTNNGQYSACKYFSADDYVTAYLATASAIREYDSTIMLISDTEWGFPKKIATGMHRPEVASLVDAYVIHCIGVDSDKVPGFHKKIRDELPYRPWFQNEYEYLKGGTTPERCLNTVQHIMNSFQIGENPSWYWIHALKPFKNSEASGYSLGFWKSLDDTIKKSLTDGYERWVNGSVLTSFPTEFKNMEYVCTQRPSTTKPGLSFSFDINQDATIYMLVEELGGYTPEGWTETNLSVNRPNGTDIIYKKQFNKGTHSFPKHEGTNGSNFGAPHACFIEGSNPDELLVQVGVNSPIKIRSEALKLEKAAANLEPGHWFYNDYNWNAVGSFVKRLPWDSRVIDINEDTYSGDARVLAFEKPNGKRTIVLSNRSGDNYTFKVNTGLSKAKWEGYRYTPYDRGYNTMGNPVGKTKGEQITITLPHLSWEFWEEK